MYLEWLVSLPPTQEDSSIESDGGGGRGHLSPYHDEYAQLLVESLPEYPSQLSEAEEKEDPSSNMEMNVMILESDSDEIAIMKVLRARLQSFLLSSTLYHPENIMKFLHVINLNICLLIIFID